MEAFMWRKWWEATNELEKEYNEYQKTAYPLVLGQCSQALRAQLDGMKGYVSVNTNQDVLEVLNMMRSLCFKHDQDMMRHTLCQSPSKA